MMFEDILSALITTIVTSVILSMLALLIKPVRKGIVRAWEFFKIMQTNGLKLFLPDNKFLSLQIFDQMIDEGKQGDEILVVGRTLRWVVEWNEDDILEGIKRGMDIKFMILNPQTVIDNPDILIPLQLADPQTIAKDLDVSVTHFRNICSEAKRNEYKGTFEVRVFDTVVVNSLTTFTSKDKRKIILDFSFSENRLDKYQQYYESHPKSTVQFANKLFDFYKKIYERSERYIQYSQGRISRGQSLTRKIVAQEIVGKNISKYSDSEEIRNNYPAYILHRIPRLFSAIENEKEPPFPISVQLELTNQCNTKCAPCLRYTWPNIQEMSGEKIKSLFEEFNNLRIRSVTLSGGEPTIRPDFLEILECASNNGIKVGILTNGLSINKEMAKAIVNYSSWVRVSLDANDPIIYNMVRGVRGGFDQVIASIHNLQDAASKSGNRTKIGICYSIQKMNIEQIPSLINYVKQEHLVSYDKGLTLKFVHGGNGFLCDREQIQKFYQSMLKYPDPAWTKLTNIHYLRKFVDIYSSHEDIANGIPLNTYYKKNRTRCFTPYTFSLIDAVGDVYPCCFLYHDNEAYISSKNIREKYRMGSIMNDSFSSIWCGDRYSRIRHDLEIIDTTRFLECRECTRHYLLNAFLTKFLNDYRNICEDAGDMDIEIFQQELEKEPSDFMWL